jgi:uncharacterized protein (DUF3084 family)
MKDIDNVLDNYDPGRPENKPDVNKQLKEIKIERENKIQEMMKQQVEYQETINKLTLISNQQMNQQQMSQQINQQTLTIQQLILENNQLKEKVEYLNNKIKQLIASQIEKRKEDKNIELSNKPLVINITPLDI